MKKILIISELSGGGVERVNRLLAKELKEKYKLYFLAVKGLGKEFVKDIDYISLDATSGRKVFFKILTKIVNIRPDYIITCNHTDTICSIIYSKFINRGCKSIFVVHSVYSSMFQYKEKKQLILQHYIPQIMQLYNKCDAVVYVSRGVGEDFKKLYYVNPKKEYIIYNPVFEYMPIQKEVLVKEFQSRVKLVTVGRIEIEKRQDILIEVVDYLMKTGIETELHIYGQGSLENRLKQLSKEKGISEQVFFEGFSTDIFNELKKYDIFILSSEFESFGNVIVEAMGIGIPVIVMNCPVGPREILEDGKYGILVPNGNVEELSKAIINTINNYPYDMIERAINAVKKYNICCIAKEYIKMFEQL